MRKVYFTRNFPPTAGDAIAAQSAGATEIVQSFTRVGYVEIAEPGDTLAERVAARCADVDALRDTKTDAGFSFNGVAYQSRSEDRANIAGAATAAGIAIAAGAQPGNLRWADPNNDFGWIATDNSVVPMDAQTVEAFFQTGAAFKAGMIFYAKALKDLIRASPSIAAVNAIDITRGWP